MKWLFWLLLLLVLVFFAVMQWGGMGAGEDKTLQPQPALHADKIVLLPMLPSALSGTALSTTQDAVPTACMEWGEFFGKDLERASAVLAGMSLGDRLTQREVEQTSGYWVYLPPTQTRAEMEKEVAQLKELGIREYFVVQEPGKWLNTISLGVFKVEDQANRYLKSVTAKGVKGARMGARKSKVPLTVFMLNNLDPPTAAKLTGLQKDFTGSELKRTACGN